MTRQCCNYLYTWLTYSIKHCAKHLKAGHFSTNESILPWEGGTSERMRNIAAMIPGLFYIQPLRIGKRYSPTLNSHCRTDFIGSDMVNCWCNPVSIFATCSVCLNSFGGYLKDTKNNNSNLQIRAAQLMETCTQDIWCYYLHRLQLPSKSGILWF